MTKSTGGGAEYTGDFIPKSELDIVVTDAQAEAMSDVNQVVRIRTSEIGDDAI